MEIDPLKIPAFMRKRRATKNTSFKPTPKFKVSSSNPLPKPKPKVFSPVFETPLFAEPQNLPPEPSLLPVGIVTHYYDKIKVAVLKLSAPLKKGVSLELMSEKGVFNQKVNSMQIDRVDVPSAPKGAEIGIKVKRRVNPGEIAYMTL